MPRTDCSWRTVSSVDSAWGQQGWGGLGLQAMLGFNKVKRPNGRWRRGGETRVSTRNQEQWRGEAGRGGDAVTLSGDVGRAAEACSPKWISQQLHGTDAAGGGSRGELGVALPGPGSGVSRSPWPGCQGARNCQAVPVFKVMTNPGSFLPGGIKRLGPQIRCVPACVCDHMRVLVGMKTQVTHPH